MSEPISIFLRGENDYLQDYKTPEKIALAIKESILTASYKPTNLENKKDIIIILIDALRSDHLPMYNYHRETMPFVDSLYKLGKFVKINQAISTCACTECGVPSLLQSKSIVNVNLNGFSIFHLLKLNNYQNFFIAPCFDKTWQSVDNLLKKQIDFFYDSDSCKLNLNDDYNILNALKSIPNKTKPSFFYFHLYSTHNAGIKHDEFKKYSPNVWGLGDNTDEKIEKSRNNLDNGILQTDFIIRQIFTTLSVKGYLNNSVLALTSDHGDEIGEFGLFTHRRNLNWTTLNIPLLFYGTDSIKFVNSKFARLIDVAPTLIDIAGYPIPKNWEGTSLYSNSPETYSYHQTYVRTNENRTYSVVYYDTPNIYRYQFDYNIKNEKLFNISIDQKEANNLINTKQKIADKLRRKALENFNTLFWIQPKY